MKLVDNGRSVLDFSTEAALRNAITMTVHSGEASDTTKQFVDSEVVRLRTLKDSHVLEMRQQGDDELHVLTESLRSKLDFTWVAACFVDLDRVHVKSAAEKKGHPFAVQSGDDIPRTGSFANVLLCSGKPFEVINDTLLDDRVQKGPWVSGEPKARFFAGVPIFSTTRQRLGCLCVLDNRPHPEGLTPLQEMEIQRAATQISNSYLNKENGSTSATSTRKRRPRSSSNSSVVSKNDVDNIGNFSSICSSPTPKRQDRSRSSSPVGCRIDERSNISLVNLPDPRLTEVDPDTYLSQLVSAMTGGKDLKIKPSASVEGFFLTVTDEHTSRYCTKVVSMARNNDVAGLRELYETQGRDALDCYNRFGEGLLTLACRRGFKDMVELLLSPEVNLSVRLRDDYGRTVVHDACWNPEPQLEICSWLLQREPSLFLMSDKRGFSPFQYARKSDWHVWRQFLFDNKEHLFALAASEKVTLFTVG